MSIFRIPIILILAFLPVVSAMGRNATAVVVDSITKVTLPRTTVYDRFGNPIAYCDKKGRLPFIPENYYPLTIRYMGFEPKQVPNAFVDTIFMAEEFLELPEYVVETNSRKILHMLGYVREYSTLTTYTDTVFLFREKMVDFMVNTDSKGKFKGWMRPRVLSSQSFYHFTDALGLDSVSDVSNHHFSWSDWIGIAPTMGLPAAVKGNRNV